MKGFIMTILIIIGCLSPIQISSLMTNNSEIGLIKADDLLSEIFHPKQLISEILTITMVDKSMKTNQRLPEENCAKVIKNFIGYQLSQKLGITHANAWDMPKKLLKRGCKEVSLKKIRNGLPKNIRELEKWDFVFFENPQSKYKYTKTGEQRPITHVAIVISKDKSNYPVIYHQWGSKIYTETLCEFIKRCRNSCEPNPISIKRVLRYSEFEKEYNTIAMSF